MAGGMGTVTETSPASLTAGETSYAWAVDFRHDLGRHLAWSASWLNEGHTATHHRDGFAGEIWGNVLTSDHLTFSLGAGAYRYFDTQLRPAGDTVNLHGWTPIYSISATYYTDSRWFLRATANRVVRASDLATNTVLIGAGRELGKKVRDLPRGLWDTQRTALELTAFAGKTIVNTGASEDAFATAVEFRDGLARNIDWTFSWINEGDPQIVRRNGLASQLWFVDEYFGRRFSLGFGIGAYWYFDQRNLPSSGKQSDRAFAGLFSPTFSVRFAPHWLARLTWNRVLSDYNRDADVILAGIGYRWGNRP